ncbi:hypothetical protein Tco_1111438, partial [Tanacetum coccineum]
MNNPLLNVGEAVRSDFYEVEQVNLENEEEVLKHDKSQEAFNLASDHTMKDKVRNEGWASNEAKAFQSSKASFAHVVNNSNTSENSPKVNFREITNAKKTDKCDFILPVEAIHAIRHKYENSLVGFFVGKKEPLITCWHPNVTIPLRPDFGGVTGFKVNNKPTVRYQVVRDNNKGHNTIAVSKDGIEVNNVFEKLYDLTELVESTKEDNEGTASLEPLRNTGKNQISSEVQNVSDDEVDKEIHVARDGTITTYSPRASTPACENSNLHQLRSLVFRNWDWTSNGAWCNKGSRIIMGWNRNDVDVVVISQDDQVMHARVWMKLERKEVFCSFV